MVYKKFGPYCLAGEDGFPENAVEVTQPFAPLILLRQEDPLSSRCLYPISCLDEVGQECPLALTPCAASGVLALDTFLRQNGGAVLNTAFPRCWDYLAHLTEAPKDGLRVTLVGLGDVGGTVLTGLKLLSREIREIQIFDPNEAQCRRYELELNQVLSPEGGPVPKVTICREDKLFDCDLFLFTASRGVPPLGSGGDVRMLQFQANREMLKFYARMARNAGFLGQFCQISDPVDHLCRAVFLESNRDENGKLDYQGLLPEQIQGFGLGVMAARARYVAAELGLPTEPVRVYGPHGAGLVVANAPGEGYDDTLSQKLTMETREMNLRVRALGFKPYIAPGLSSAAISILRLARGLPHYGAVPLGGVYFGCTSVMTRFGPQICREPLAPAFYRRIEAAYDDLRRFSYE